MGKLQVIDVHFFEKPEMRGKELATASTIPWK